MAAWDDTMTWNDPRLATKDLEESFPEETFTFFTDQDIIQLLVDASIELGRPVEGEHHGHSGRGVMSTAEKNERIMVVLNDDLWRYSWFRYIGPWNPEASLIAVRPHEASK